MSLYLGVDTVYRDMWILYLVTLQTPLMAKIGLVYYLDMGDEKLPNNMF